MDFNQFFIWVFSSMASVIGFGFMYNMNKANKTLERLEDSINTLNMQIAVVVTRVDGHEKRIDSHEQKINQLEEK